MEDIRKHFQEKKTYTPHTHSYILYNIITTTYVKSMSMLEYHVFHLYECSNIITKNKRNLILMISASRLKKNLVNAKNKIRDIDFFNIHFFFVYSDVP